MGTTAVKQMGTTGHSQRMIQFRNPHSSSPMGEPQQQQSPYDPGDWRAACQHIEDHIESLEKQANELRSIRATLMVNFAVNRPSPVDGVIVGPDCPSTHEAMVSAFRQYHQKLEENHQKIENIRKAIEAIVIPEGVDAGVLLVSVESLTRNVKVDGVPRVVYENEYFTDMGEALVELWKMTGATESPSASGA